MDKPNPHKEATVDKAVCFMAGLCKIAPNSNHLAELCLMQLYAMMQTVDEIPFARTKILA